MTEYIIDCGDDPDCEQCPNPCKRFEVCCDECECPDGCLNYVRSIPGKKYMIMEIEA